MTISKDQLAQGIRFAGERAAAAAAHCKDWDHQLGHQWTTRDAFAHIASVVGGAQMLAPLFEAGALSGLSAEQIAGSNAQSIAKLEGKSRDDIIQAIRDGAAASAAFVETLDDDKLQKVIKLGGYEMPNGEILAQIFIHHTVAHAYEASARWPIT